jgi:hypothetical protein
MQVDGFVLASVIRTLGVVLECAANGPGTARSIHTRIPLGSDPNRLERPRSAVYALFYDTRNALPSDCISMAKAFMDFLYAARYHDQTAVRRSILFGLTAIVKSVPTASLLQCMSAPRLLDSICRG